MTESVNLLEDGMKKYISKIDYTSTWSVAHHLRFLMIGAICKDKKNVLDVGFGHNFTTKYLEDVGFWGSYTGIDLNKQYVDEAKLGTYKFPTQFLNCSIYDIKEKYDAVILGEIIEHLTDESERLKFLTYCKQLLEKDGVIIMTTPNRIGKRLNWPENHEYELSYEECLQLISQSGFIVEKCFGLWADTAYTINMLSRKDKFLYDELVKYFPRTLVNVFFNLKDPKKSRALFFVLRASNFKTLNAWIVEENKDEDESNV